MDPLRVGLCGLGTVAQGVLQVLRDNAEGIARRAGRQLQVVAVASRTAKPEVDLGGATFSTDVLALAGRDDLDVVVELIGGEDTALQLVETALSNGTHVVTGNKAIVALHGERLLSLASANSAHLGFEAAVAGGIPIISSLTNALAGNAHEWIVGIINGTSNFILTAMAEQGQSFSDALEEAQALGYAEADPTFDVEGVDAAHKLTILTALGFGAGFRFDDVYVEGISAIAVEDIEYARQLGYVIKHIGMARRRAAGIEARVHPALVPQSHLLSSIGGATNAVMVRSNAAGDTFYAGAGAGALPTASAVVGDLVDISKSSARLPRLPDGSATPLLPIDRVETEYYLRIPSLDQPGAFARVATILSECKISIEAAIQREQAAPSLGEGQWVPIVILTHAVEEQVMNRALAEVQALPEVVGEITRIRVEQLSATN